MKHLIKTESTANGVLGVKHTGLDNQYCEAGELVILKWQPDAKWGLQEAHYTDKQGNITPIDLGNGKEVVAFVMPDKDIVVGGTFKRFAIEDWKFAEAKAGNLASIDANENIADSGIAASDVATKEELTKVNPFKGWFSNTTALNTAYPTPSVGDYAYVKGATSSDPASIYECTTAGTWTDSGRTADTSNVQTFATGEEVNETYIDDTHLANPVAGSLAKAEDVALLNEKLREVTLEETKVSIVTSGEGQNTYSDKFLKNDGKIAIPSNTTNTQVNLLIINVGDAKRVRFLGAQTNASSISMSYGFAASAPDPSDTTNMQVNVADLKNWDTNQDSISAKQYIIDVPDGKPWFVCTISKYFSSTQVMTLDEFYCYKESGDVVNITDILSTQSSMQQEIDLMQTGSVKNCISNTVLKQIDGKTTSAEGVVTSDFIPYTSGNSVE